MAPDNYFIADQFSLLSRLMDIHGENSFKSKAYSAAAFTIEKLPQQLSGIDINKLSSIKGIGDSGAKKSVEVLQTGRLKALDDLVQKTPPGIMEMLSIKGLGPKKIATIWKEMEIESIGELLYACNENRLTLYKGFGEKTQKNVQEAIEFYLSNIGSYLFAQIESYAEAITQKLKSSFEDFLFLISGHFRRHIETIDTLEWVTTAPLPAVKDFMLKNNFVIDRESENFIAYKGEENILLAFNHSSNENIYTRLFETSCSENFLAEWNKTFPAWHEKKYASEDEIFAAAGTDVIPAYMREKEDIIHQSLQNKIPQVIQAADITAIIHSHSKWSDGVNTIEEMAKEAIRRGLQFLVISDHSKSAFYANGLTEERIKAQHAEIDELNKKLAPFKIFKSIESDILNDGSLDYDDATLASFDLVIASVHSNLKMNEEKAMMRLMNAISNPYTNILGHMTGRLLLSRNGYPVNHKTIIDLCAEKNVVIELNAHPRRLDIDWRWIDYCIEKSVLISIDPDAHALEGFDDTKYGVLAAQKAGLEKAMNLSSFSLNQFEQWLSSQHRKRH